MSKKAKAVKFVSGVVLFFSGLWVGAYVMQFADGTWWGAPAFVTFCWVSLTGVVLLANSSASYYDPIEHFVGD